MVTCTACGKPMDKVPNWMESIKVEFICNNCPKRQTKNIAFLNVENIIAPVSAKPSAESEADTSEVEDEE